MEAGQAKLPPGIQTLVDKRVFDRLPVTFSTFFFDQIKEWHLLFPAEQSYYERLLSLIERSEAQAVVDLFASMRAAERMMNVNEKTWPRGQFTLEHVDFLNRSPHYPEWRKAAGDVFAKLDPVLDAEIARNGRPRLVVVLSPRDLPVGPDRMWTRIARLGRRIAIEPPGEIDDYVPLLLTGKTRDAHAPTIGALHRASRAKNAYEAWAIDAGETLGGFSREGVIGFSYAGLDRYRTRLMSEVNRIVDKEKIRGPRQLGARLRELRITASEGDAAQDPVLAEFVRGVLLSGNGTLLVNNTFVEWATVQAVRRARPSMMVAAFGIRNKVKPFSSLLIYTDQEAANPIPTQMDTLGSYVDLEVFYEYIWQEFEKYAEYRRNTAYLFAGEGMDEMLAIAPPDFPLLGRSGTVKLSRVFEDSKHWLAL